MYKCNDYILFNLNCFRIAIGDGNDIIPNDFEVEGPYGNLLECIITSGKLLLDIYYCFKQRSLLGTQLDLLDEMVEVALYQLERLYSWKCWFREQYSVNDGGIKMHGLLHFVSIVRASGTLENTDTRIYEYNHKEYAKIPYKAGSKRTGSLPLELFERLEKKRLIGIVGERYSEVYGEATNGPAVSPKTPKRIPFKSYETQGQTVVTYKCSSYQSSSNRVCFDMFRNCLVPCADGKIEHLNPLLKLEILWHEVQQIGSANSFIRHFKNNDEGSVFFISILYLYNLNNHIAFHDNTVALHVFIIFYHDIIFVKQVFNNFLIIKTSLIICFKMNI